jgi:hypothetical protein
MNKPEFSIIIVDYNSSDYLLPCLKSIDNHLKLDYEVIVVDNNSYENHLKDYEQISSKIKTIRSDKNLGYGGANNLGAREALGPYLLFLNPDTLLIDDSIARMLEFLKANKTIGIVIPKILTEKNGPEETDYYGDFPTFKSLVTRHNHRHIMKYPADINPESTYEVGVGYLEAERVTGASLMIKKELFNKVGGFDTGFFMYFEDTDLCKKVYDLGYKNAVFLASSIVHFGGRTQSSTSSPRVRAMHPSESKTDRPEPRKGPFGPQSNGQKSNKLKKKNYYFSQDYFFKKHYGIAKMYLMKSVRFFYLLTKS